MADTIAELQAMIRVKGLAQVQQDFIKVRKGAQNAGNAVGKLGGKSTMLSRQMNQLSFGVQDFMVVLGDGGLGRALSASSNNFAQMAAMMGSAGGALIGFGVTALALSVGPIQKLIMGNDDAAESYKRVEAAAVSAGKAAKRAATESGIREAGRQGQFDARRVKTTEQAREQVVSQAFIREQSVKAARDLERQRSNRQINFLNKLPQKQKIRIGRGLLGLFGKDAKPSPVSTQNPAVRRKQEKRALDEFNRRVRLAQNISEFARSKGGVQLDANKGFESLVKDPAFKTDAGRKIREKILDSPEEDQIRKKAAAARIAQANIDALRKRELQLQPRENRKRRQKEFEERKKGRQQQDKIDERESAIKRRSFTKETEGSRRAIRAILKELDPAAEKTVSINDKFDEIDKTIRARGGTRESELLRLSGAARKKALATVEKQGKVKQLPGISGAFKAPAFAKQLESSLLKSDSQKKVAENTKKTAANTKDLIDEMRELKREISDLNLGFN